MPRRPPTSNTMTLSLTRSFVRLTTLGSIFLIEKSEILRLKRLTRAYFFVFFVQLSSRTMSVDNDIAFQQEMFSYLQLKYYVKKI